MRGGDVAKRNLKEFTIVSNEIQHIVIRNSKLAGAQRCAGDNGATAWFCVRQRGPRQDEGMNWITSEFGRFDVEKRN